MTSNQKKEYLLVQDEKQIVRSISHLHITTSQPLVHHNIFDRNSASGHDKKLRKLKRRLHDFDHPEKITKNLKGTQSNVMMTFKFYESKSEARGLRRLKQINNENQKEQSLLEEQQVQDEEDSTCNLVIQILQISIPSLITLVLLEIVMQINILFVKEFNNEAMMASLGFINAISNSIPAAVCEGISCALETLVSQAYGYKRFDLCGHYLNQMIISNTLVFIPISIIIWYSGNLLSLINDLDHETVDFAQEQLRIMIPGLYMMSLFIGFCMYYTSMSKPGYPMLIQLICVPMHALWCYLLMFYFEMGYKGCAVAFNVTYTLSFLLIILIGKFSPDPEIQGSLVRLQKKSFHNLKGFAKISANGMFIIMLEYWCSDIIQIWAGQLGKQHQAAMVVVTSIANIIYYIPLSFACALQAIVGSQIGLGQIKKAKKVVNLTCLISSIIFLLIILLIVINARYISQMYKGSVERQEITYYCLIAYSAAYAFDSAQNVLLGIIKGLGIQYSAQNQAIICFLFISLPSAYLLAFKGGYGVNGLWIGYGIGLAFLSISYLITLSSADWDKISIEVQQRMDQEGDDYDRYEESPQKKIEISNDQQQCIINPIN